MCMGRFIGFVSICIEFYSREFSCVDVYLDYGCATLYDTLLFYNSGWKGVRELFKGPKEI